MDISICTEEDIPQLKALWQQCFEDSEEYIEYYFSYVAKRNIIFAAKDNGKIVSMVHLNPYNVFVKKNGLDNIAKHDASSSYNKNVDDNIYSCNNENVYYLHYIVGVATAVTHRKKGIMKYVLNEALAYLRNNNEPVTYLMPASQAYYTGLGFELLENSYVISCKDILKRYDAIKTKECNKKDSYDFVKTGEADMKVRYNDEKHIPDGIYYLESDISKKILCNTGCSISEKSACDKECSVWGKKWYNTEISILVELYDSIFQDFNNRLSLIYDMFVIRDMQYMVELDEQCKALGGKAYILFMEGKIVACFGVMFEAGRADIVQYIATEKYMEHLAYILKHLNYNWNDSFELFENIKKLLSYEVKVDKGHGIMYNILDKNFSKYVNFDKKLMINEIV